MEEKTPLSHEVVAFRYIISRPQIINMRSRNQIRGKLLLSRKLRHFRGSRFSQCFIISTAPNYSLPSKILLPIIILSNYQQCPPPLVLLMQNKLHEEILSPLPHTAEVLQAYQSVCLQRRSAPSLAGHYLNSIMPPVQLVQRSLVPRIWCCW